jgi:putative membrane protein
MTPNAGDGRRPGWVYGTGSDPDVRFSFANERTFLAWIRTALALLAAGVAIDAVPLEIPDWEQRALASVLLLLGIACTVAAWTRWAQAERAMRRGDPLPAPRATVILTVGVLAVGVIVLLGAVR